VWIWSAGHLARYVSVLLWRLLGSSLHIGLPSLVVVASSLLTLVGNFASDSGFLKALPTDRIGSLWYFMERALASVEDEMTNGGVASHAVSAKESLA